MSHALRADSVVGLLRSQLLDLGFYKHCQTIILFLLFQLESVVLGLCLRAGPGEERRARAASLVFHSWLSAVLPTQH